MSETEPAEPVFSDTVEECHRRVDAGSWDNIYVVGDVHGCAEELDALLGRLSPSEDELVVFVGDLVNKGPDSEAVVQKVMGMDNCLTVRGNNEQKVVDGRSDPGLSEESRGFVESTPIVVSWGSNIVVHGGVSPAKPFRAHGPTDLLEARSICGNGYDGTFWFERYERDARVFFGHTVLDTPLDLGNAVGLDTGCVYGGGLTAYDTESGEFVSVEADRTYRKRSRSHIVSARDVL
jgi:serine/threonine protein phosphatase 1